MEIAGRSALVTGAAGGIGLAIARALQTAGAQPILADIDGEALARAAADLGGVPTLALDVTDRVHWAEALARFPQVDILVNNAGIGPDGRELADMEPASFDRLIRVNLTSVFNGVSTFGARMRARGSGHIVNTASMAGLTPMPTIGAYTAAKFGVVGLSEALRAEMEPHGVGVSVLCPGLVATRLRETTLKAGSETPSASPSASLVAMDADVVGRLTVDGIRANKALIVTHGEYARLVERRMAWVISAFDGVPPAS